MSLNFGSHPDVVFDDAPLVTVLCQIKFPPILALLSAAGVAGFQAALRDDYPTMQPPERQAAIDVGPDSVGVQTSAPIWRFTDSTGEWTLGLSADFVSLETPRYSSIEEFLERMRTALKVLRRTVRPADSLRIGMRKINKFDLPQANQTASLVGIVRRELLGPLAVPEYPAPISAGWGFLQFADDENELAIRYGLLADASEAPAFILDMDYSTNRPQAVDANEDLVALLKHFSDGMTSFFHWAVDAEHKATMRPRPRRLESTS